MPVLPTKIRSFFSSWGWIWFRGAVLRSARARSRLGVAYADGHGVEQDYEKAVEWFRKAARQGYAEAQYNLGIAYADGHGVAPSHEKAIGWFRKAADQGYAMAQRNLGIAYAEGAGVAPSHEKAVEWFHKAAEQDDVEAQFNLGVAYAEGEGTIKDIASAHMWFNIAASRGLGKAAQDRERLERNMTPSQCDDAVGMAREWVEKHRKRNKRFKFKYA